MENNLKIIEGLFTELKKVDIKILELTNTVDLFLAKKVNLSFELKVKIIKDDKEEVLTSDGSLRNPRHTDIFDPVTRMLRDMRRDLEKGMEEMGYSKPSYTITNDLNEEDMYIVMDTIHKNLKKEKERILKRLQLYGVDTEKLTSK